MHLKNKIVYAVLLLATFLSLSRLFAASTISVPSSTYPTIQSGIDAANPGDIVEVALGNYTGRLVIDKDNLTLQGAGAGVTFLNISGTGGTAITFDNVSGSTVRGFTIKNADIGVRAVNSKANVTNNIFIRNKSAFENSSSFSRAINNTFYRNTRAVFTNSSSTLKNNIIAGSGRYGVVGSRAGSITYNLFWKNALRDYSGILVPSPTFSNITGKNPIFVNFTSDFHLRAGSPAIKRGDPLLKNSFNNTTSDIGVYGGPNADVKPATVTGVAAVSTKDKVTISWKKNMAYNITGYNVHYGTASNNLASAATVFGNSTTFMPPTIISDTRYYFAVSAVAANDIPQHESDKSSTVFGAVDTIPPAEPTNVRADIGDKRLFLSWNAVINDINGGPDTSGVRGYKVHYGTSPGTYLPPVDVGSGTSYELTGLTNDVTYYIAISAYDYAGNNGSPSTEVSQTPEVINGIVGLKDSGGCFIATAAYGSYEEKHVKILREFRDRYLLTNIPGKAFVSFYYRTSPPVADFIRNNEALKALVRTALLPLIGFAWMLINYPLLTVWFGLLAVGYRLWILRLRPVVTRQSPVVTRLTPYVSLLTLFFLLTAPSVSFGDERTGFSFGLSYGQLEPASDEWKEIYDDDRVSNYRLFLGYRPHPTISAEIGAGYMTKNGRGMTITGRETGVRTTFQSAPVDLTLLYRLNYVTEQVIVPYIGGGVSYNFYWENVKDGDELKGGMWGYHATGGLQFLLDYIDPGSSTDMSNTYEVENTYLVIGATHSVIDDFGDEKVDIGGWNYNVGLVFEF